MSRMTSLAWRLTRLGGRGALLSTGLTALAVAVATLLLQFAVAGNSAFAERAERTEWRSPAAVDEGSAILASSTDYFEGRSVTRVDLAALSDDAPVPPGVDAFPAVGEVWLSPALAELLSSVPDKDFVDRYQGAVVGELDEEALVHPEELLVMVGRDAADPVMTTERFSADIVSPRVIDGFDNGTSNVTYGFYQLLMILATVFMVVPVAIFGAASARLTVARRDERLATLRLVGATPGQVVRMTLIEALLAAVAGTVIGTALWMVATPAVSRIPIDGGPWYVSDLWAGPQWMALVALCVPVLVVVSAVFGLRSVVISPLGVARRVRPPKLRAVRLVVFAIMVIAFLAMSQLVGGGDLAVAAAVLLGLLAGTIAAVNLVGPWVVQQIGKVFARTARGPERMLAARRLLDDPKAAWRTVAGVVLAGFVAGFTALMPMIVTDTDTGERETLAAEVTAEDAEELAAATSVALDGVAEVSIADGSAFMDPNGEGNKVILAETSGEQVEAVRTIMTAVLPGDSPEREVDAGVESNGFISSIRVGITVVLSVVFITAAVSAAVNGIGSVLDRRKTYRLLHLSGTPMRVLDRARRQETLLPLAILGGGSILTGMVLAFPFVGLMGFDIEGIVILTATLTVGTAAVIGAGALSRPLLQSVMDDVSPRPD